MNKTFKKIINALILTAILMSTSYLYSTNVAQAQHSQNTLNIDNQPGKVLSIIVHRDDFVWLDFTTNKWGTTKTFVPSNNIHHVTGSTDSISLIDTGIHSARVYVFSSPQLQPTGVPSFTAPKRIFDYFEYHTDQIWDITAVDGFGMPMALEYKTRMAGYRNIPRDFILKQFLHLPPPFNSKEAIIRDESNNIIRVLAPKHYTLTNVLNHVLDKAMDLGFPKFIKSASHSIMSGQWTYTDFSTKANPRTLKFKVSGKKFTIGGEANPFSSNNVISTSMAEQNDASGRFTALVETAINRGVLYDSALWGSNDQYAVGFPWNYYQDNTSNANQYSYYAKTIHQWSINGSNYGLDQDDLYSRSTSITVPPGEPVTLHIWKFTGDSHKYKPITWPNQNYLVLSVPQTVIDHLGILYVNNKQYIIPDTRNAGAVVGLPQFTNLQFSKVPGTLLKLDVAHKKVLNSQKWLPSNGVQIDDQFHVAFDSKLRPK